MAKSNTLTTTTFKVKNTIAYQMGHKLGNCTASYSIVLTESHDVKYHFELDRTNFKINGEILKNKFTVLSHEYFCCLFPIAFKIQKDYLEVANAKEIIKRITVKDNQLAKNTKGSGFEYIRNAFIEKTNTIEKINQFITDLNIIKHINLNQLRYTTPFVWELGNIGKCFWELPLKRNIQDNKATLFTTKLQEQDLLRTIKEYDQKKECNMNFDASENLILANFNHTIQYDEQEVITMAQTHLKIVLEDSFFEETISLELIQE